MRSYKQKKPENQLPSQALKAGKKILQRLASKESRSVDHATDAKSLPTSSVNDIVQSHGKPLDDATRSRMEMRFGHDFSRVRVHTDSKAANSALRSDALAYTVGNHIVFSKGKFQPQTEAGQKLLSHELAHVVQQQSVLDTNGLQMGEPGSAYEREAEQANTHNAGGPPIQVQMRTGIPTIQRTLAGGIIGGLTGLGAGVVLGALAGGPIGAVIGGLIGLIGGAMIGEHATTRRRNLNREEINLAHEIFEDSIDYSRIEITRDSLYAVGAPRTIGNTIHLKSDWGHFEGDSLDLTERGRETLIHEMAHVWQYQNGGLAYIPLSLIAQLRAAVGSGERGAAYNWRAAHEAGTPWAEWNPEQQAQLVEDYNSALRRIQAGRGTAEDYNTVSIALPYIEMVRRREGAPTFGSGVEDRDILTRGTRSP